MGQDLRWLLAMQGLVTPEEAARVVRGALGVELSGQSVQAIDPEHGEYADMVLLQGPPSPAPPWKGAWSETP
eukprot:11029883-Alexandrium_andersonii.AAC.1